MFVVTKLPGHLAEAMPFTGRKVGLEFLQKSVAGYIELVRVMDGLDMFINEEGKLIGMDPNIWLAHGDIIAGPLVVCGHDNMGNSIPISKELADNVVRWLNRRHVTIALETPDM